MDLGGYIFGDEQHTLCHKQVLFCMQLCWSKDSSDCSQQQSQAASIYSKNCSCEQCQGAVSQDNSNHMPMQGCHACLIG